MGGGIDFLLGPGATFICLAIAAQLIANHRSMPVPRELDERSSDPKRVSVLIPARNEQENIGACLESVRQQWYPDLEIIVADDRSTDDTALVVSGFADVILMRLEGPPEGWTGKNWACDQLSRRATGDVLCFIDADTILEPDAIGAALDVLDSEEAGLVSLLPAVEYQSKTESVLMPMVSHGVLALVPLWLMHTNRFPRVAMALGPFLMIRREVYDFVGGHAGAPSEIVDDVRLARAVKSAGHPVRVLNGTALVRTRWYPSLGQIWDGFAKNAFGAIGSNLMLALLTLLVILPLMIAPFVRVISGVALGSIAAIALVQVTLLLGARTATSVAARDPLWSVPLHPLTVAFWVATLARSIYLSLTDRTIEWSGRSVSVRNHQQ